MVEFLAGELRTGRRLTQLPVTRSSRWSCVLNKAGEVTATIPLADQSISRRAEILAQIEPTRCFLAVQVGESIVEAGPIWSHDFDHATGNLTVRALGLWSLFDHRLVIPVLAAGQTPEALTLAWSGLSLGTIAKRLVSTAMAHTGGSLPVVLPTDETGTSERTYPGYELATTARRLEELTQVQGGPDVAFQPRLTADRLGIEWVMRVGTTTDPLLHQDGDDWVWDTGTPRGGLSGVSVNVDATGRVNRAWAEGDGFETSLLVGTHQDSTQWDRGYPLLETVLTHSTVTRTTTLNAHARAAVSQGSAPWSTWRVTAELGTLTDTSGSMARPGDWARVVIPPTHVYLRSGEYRARVGKITGDAQGRFAGLELLPVKEAR